MSQHYSFYDNKVTEHGSWLTILPLSEGVFFYSPHDFGKDKWGKLVKTDGRVWVSVPKQDMPKGFLVQLLLMGVPC